MVDSVLRYDRKKFFDAYKKCFGKLKQNQVEALEFLLGKLEQSKRIDSIAKHAYVLATIRWETATSYEPITEYGSDNYLKSKKYYPYIGRGYVQLTWLINYKKFGSTLKIDLVKKPELANDPEIAWQILEIGMTDGEHGIQDADFTNSTLEDFFSDAKKDFYCARKIINPKDYRSYEPVEKLSELFYKILTESEK